MDVSGSVDRLISSLESFRAAMPSVQNEQTLNDFDALFSEASLKIDALSADSAVGVATASTDELVPTELTTDATFATFQTQNWLVDSEADAILNRPNMREFMDATGCDAPDASELLYGVIGSNADLRDWSKIMSSGNPVDAARAATGQMYNSDKDYALVKHADYGTVRFADTLNENSLSSKTVLSRNGNFADIETNADTGASEKMAVSSTGLLLRGAGSTQDQINRTAWLFGFDATGVLI